ncbi:MAG: ParA family protein [Parvularculaceae bacterium]|nr:ParA family protein [Parvularculaceae bacterium]
MAFVITIAQRKGGAGKTTLAAHLAADLAGRGCAVAAIDLDDQQSFSHWARRRLKNDAASSVALDESSGFSLGYRLARIRAANDVVIIDTPPAADRIVEGAMRAADLILAPMQLTPLDLDASLPTARMIGASLRPGLFVVNRAPPRARVADLIREKIAASRLPVAKVELGGRAAFAESLAIGLTAGEIDRRSAAADEIRRLCDQILDLAGARLNMAS